MIAFLLAALTLTLFVVALLSPSLLRRRKTEAHALPRASVALLREQLDELKAEHAAGNLTQAEFAEAEDELKRRVLEESHPGGTSERQYASTTDHPAPAVKTAIALTLVLVMGGFGLYGFLGNLLALQPELAQSAARQAEAEEQMTPEQIAAMTERLAERLEKNPDDPEGWQMLARSYKMLNRPAEAAAAYARIEPIIAQNANLLADYAEALAMSSETRLNGKPRQLLTEALQLDPNNARALFLAGMAALEAGEKPKAAEYWEKLLPRVEEGSELHTLLTNEIAKIKSGGAGAR